MNPYSRGPLPQHALLMSVVADRQLTVHGEMGLHAQRGLEGLLKEYALNLTVKKGWGSG